MILSDTEQKIINLLKQRGPQTCTMVGETLWHNRRHRQRQAYARPAGRFLHKLKEMGLVDYMLGERWDHGTYWGLTHKGLKT